MIATTLKALRTEGACIGGYNRLVRTLQGREFTSADAERESYISYAHKEPIPLAVVLESNGIDDALWALRACEQAPAMVRAERLYGAWCARRVQHLMTDPRSVAALDVAERHANSDATDEELDAAWGAAWDAAQAAAWDAAWGAAQAAAQAAARDAAWAAAWDAAWAAAWDAAWDAAQAAAWDAAWGAAWGAAQAAARDAARAAARDAQKQMFIAVFCGDELNVDAMYRETAVAE